MPGNDDKSTHPLMGSAIDDESDWEQQKDDSHGTRWHSFTFDKAHSLLRHYSVALAVLSLLLNIFTVPLLLVQINRSLPQREQASQDSDGVGFRTAFAGLAWDQQIPFNSSSEYGTGSDDDKARSELWESMDTTAGEISLDREWARAHGLPDSTPFFWDKSRSIYLVNGYHLLHCMRKVRRWVTISYHNGTQMDSYVHLVHCMDQLLQNIVCQADDTPLYTVPHANATTGLGQPRQCRSWAQLERWVRSQDACFAYVNETQGVDAVIKRFRYCPRGSPYAPAMRAHFAYPDDWFRERPRDIDTMPRYWDAF